MRFWAALLAGKIVAFFCRLFRHPGTSLPGAVALKICPQLLSILAPAYEQVVAVTGTNGKTTTANLIAHILRSSNISAANNYEGANMITGVATALIKDCTLRGKARSQVAILEVDEGSVGKVFPAVKPDLVVVTNYFRDQLDRYSELNHNITLLRRVLTELPKTSLLLNADDPLVVTAGRDQSAVSYYGVKGKQSEDETSDCDIREGKLCPDCGNFLSYHYYHYGQLGDYYCTGCAFKRPLPDFLAYDVKDDHYLEFTLDVRQSKDFCEGCSAVNTLRLGAPMQGFYNIYNVLAASAAAITLGVSQQVITASLMEYIPATGRMERFLYKGSPCTLALIKNPAGLNEVLKTLLRTEGEKALVIAINDLAADGRDVSWLWDAGLEMMNDQSIKKVICSGRRAGDTAVRLKYAGVPRVKLVLEPECRESLEILGLQGAKEYFVLASYTNLSRYANLLEKMGKDVVKGCG
jgi:UDP-N-acetylmuramyl tripeptide synthase